MKRGIFAVDGGNATGLAWGVFDGSFGTVSEAWRQREAFGSATINRRIVRDGTKTIDGKFHSDVGQVEEIYRRWVDFQISVKRARIDCHTFDMVIEDFILLPGAHAGGKDGVASVRIAWGLTGYMLAKYIEDDIVWQTPSEQGRITDDYLRRNEAWIPGRDHERTCVKHIFVRLGKTIA